MWWCSVFERIADHATRAPVLLPEQNQKTSTRALLSSWMPEFQAVEDALWQVLDATLDSATGARLAQFAALVGEPRAGLLDEALYKVARARIAANRSRGRDADLATVLAWFGVPFEVVDFAPAAVLVTLGAFPGDGLPRRIASLVRRAVAGGVGAQTVSPVVEGASLVFASQSEDVEVAPGAGLSDAAQTQGGALSGVMT